jgi:hypothetical protein
LDERERAELHKNEDGRDDPASKACFAPHLYLCELSKATLPLGEIDA